MGSENGPYKGLLIDYGGVLTTDLFDSFGAFCRREGLAPETVTERLRHDRGCRELLIAFETGRLEEGQFETRFAAMLGVPAPELIDRMFAGSRPDPAMAEAVRAAHDAGIRTGLVSNSWGTRRYDRALLSELFDAVLISGEVGIRKPTPEIYRLAAKRIGVVPQQCVFVDDLPFNLGPAAELGMATVQHVSAQQTVAELDRLLGVAELLSG
jgi:epoxide hydrolase-like predicted phosphatase